MNVKVNVYKRNYNKMRKKVQGSNEDYYKSIE